MTIPHSRSPRSPGSHRSRRSRRSRRSPGARLVVLLVGVLGGVLPGVAARASPSPSPSSSPSSSPMGKSRSIVRAAVARAHLDEEATRRLRLRAHLAPLLPQLRVSAGQGWQVGYTRGLDGLTTPSVDGDRFNYAVSASWDLGRVLLPREEVLLLRELPRRAQLRSQLEIKVLSLLAERCQLRHRARPVTTGSRPDRLAEVELMLDVLSGGHPLPDETEPCLARIERARGSRIGGSAAGVADDSFDASADETGADPNAEPGDPARSPDETP